MPNPIGFEMDGLGSLYDHSEWASADGRGADLVGAGDGDRADWVAEQSEVGKGAQVGDAMPARGEGCPDGQGQVVGGS